MYACWPTLSNGTPSLRMRSNAPVFVWPVSQTGMSGDDLLHGLVDVLPDRHVLVVDAEDEDFVVDTRRRRSAGGTA